jgi:hypothetical protein
LVAASLTIAAFADWLGGIPSAPILLPPLLGLLTSALSAPEDACAAAALALKHVCDGEFDLQIVSVVLEPVAFRGQLFMPKFET